VEEKIENGRVVDGFDLVSAPIVSGPFFDGSLSLNSSCRGRGICIGRVQRPKGGSSENGSRQKHVFAFEFELGHSQCKLRQTTLF